MKKSSKQLIKFCTIGTLLEWYDFTIFGMLSSTLAIIFFPSSSKSLGLIATFGIFASGFIMRPIGAIVLGHLGDKHGRKFTLLLNVIAVTISTASIGLLPTYSQIGVISLVLLLVCRLLQGFFVGAEYSGVITYLAEMSEPHNICFYASFSAFGTVGGLFLGSIISAGTTWLFPSDSLLSIGWRIPFLLSIFLGVVSYYIRNKLNESPAFMLLQKENKIDKTPIKVLLKKYKISLLRVMAFFGTSTILTYISFVYIPTKISLHNSSHNIMLLNSIAIFFFAILILVFGKISDKIGSIKIVKFATILILLTSYPLFYLFQQNNIAFVITGLLISASITALFVAPIPSITANLFPTNVRYSGSSIGLNFSASILGGTAPMIASWLTSYTNNFNAPAIYIIFSAILSAVAIYSIHTPENNN